jgi:mannosyltransferase OCH1-like enzyme
MGKRTGWHKSTKIYLFFAFVAIIILIQLSSKRTLFSKHNGFRKVLNKEASALSPAELMSRPLSGFQTQIPKIFHQSWSSSQLPAKFQQWSEACRRAHPDWEWVLWTDEDNLELVKKFMPSMLPTYEKLDGPIFRADLIRNAYMLLFGG